MESDQEPIIKVVQIDTHPNVFKRLFFALLGIKHNKTLVSQHGNNFLISREVEFNDGSPDQVELTHVKSDGSSRHFKFERKRKHK